MEKSENKNFLDKLNERISRSVTIKLFSIGILILLLLIPKSMITSLIEERESRMWETIQEVTDKWSRKQTVSGPVVIIPYKNHIWDRVADKETEVIEHITLLPEALNIKAVIEPEERYRGIFKVIVYKAKLSINGEFIRPDPAALDIDEKDVMWSKARLNIGISDLRGIEQEVFLKQKGNSLPFNPGISSKKLFDSGIHIPLPDTEQKFFGEPFTIEIPLKGSEELYFVPVGKTTVVQMKSSWKDPSFTGIFLPEQRTIDQNGFTATWKVLHFNRNYPQSWTDTDYPIEQSKFGVNLLVAADHYQKSLRTSKYAILIISLSFLMFFLIEVTKKLRIHPFQYILIGLALIIFYTLLLSVSEHFGFNAAYGISAVAITVMISLYSMPLFNNKKLTLLLTASLATVYTFIFIIIQIETYALLVGSIGLFIILAVTMYITRKIKWYGE